VAKVRAANAYFLNKAFPTKFLRTFTSQDYDYD
jgi:hypothetical protein